MRKQPLRKAERLARELGLPYLEELPSNVPTGLRDLLTEELRLKYRAVVAGGVNERPLLATDDPVRLLERLPEIAFEIGTTPELAVVETTQLGLMTPIRGGDVLAAALEELRTLESRADLAVVEQDAAAAPVARYSSLILKRAVQGGASDLHLEPSEHGFSVRMRVDGWLRELPAPSKRGGMAVIARLKLLANLDLGDRFSPQDGRLREEFDGRAVDFRIAILPATHGESAVIRILDAKAAPLTLARAGMPEECREAVSGVVQSGTGLLLTTGPTGSGKTTTLYGILNMLDREQIKVISAEDPVEYEVSGVMQMPIRPELGLDFRRALRSFLRHDPDVIMVGEVRDAETAHIAAQAALTGHLVLASLHAASAVKAPLRLLELGLKPWLVASALELALAQRLLRRECPCGNGCLECNNSGYLSRAAIYEWLRMSPPLRELLHRGALGEFERVANESMSQTLHSEGLRLVEAGEASFEELNTQLGR